MNKRYFKLKEKETKIPKEISGEIDIEIKKWELQKRIADYNESLQKAC